MSVPFVLIVERGPEAGREIPLGRESLTAGRQADNAIVFADNRLSRRHARFDVGPAGVTVTDLASANGTSVNGERLARPRLLHPGDVVDLGGAVAVRLSPGAGGAARDAGGELGAPQVADAPPPGPRPPGPIRTPPAPPPAPRKHLPLIIGGAVATATLLCVCLALAFFALGGAVKGGAASGGRSGGSSSGSAAGSGGNAGSASRKAGYITGKVTNGAGTVITGGAVTVGISGTTLAGERTSFEAHPGADGTYAQRVPDGLYTVTAYVEVPYNGKTYSLGLDPDDNQSRNSTYDAATGIVKDFTWKISGPIPGASGDPRSSFYGGTIKVTDGNFSNGSTTAWLEKRYPGAKVEVTLTPRGPLIDGSTGQTLVKTVPVDGTIGGNAIIADVPIGAYSASARLVQANGAPLPLTIALGDTINLPYAASAQVDFPPFDKGGKPYGLSSGVALSVKD